MRFMMTWQRKLITGADSCDGASSTTTVTGVYVVSERHENYGNMRFSFEMLLNRNSTVHYSKSCNLEEDRDKIGTFQ